jgi:hypothetical protein
MKRIAILLLAAAPACAAREASERPQVGPAPVARSASPSATQAPPSIPLRAFTHAPNCAGWPASTEIGVERTPRGAALVFTNADHIGSLRARVAAMPEARGEGEAVRLDNVEEGIRLVYEGGGSVSEVHESARLRARELRRVCGLARYIPSEEPPPEKGATAATNDTPPPASPPASASKGNVTKPETTQPRADEKPKAGDKPKTGDKPKASDTPKKGDKPAAPAPAPAPPKPKEPVKPKPPAPPAPGDPKPPEPPKPPESPFPRT